MRDGGSDSSFSHPRSASLRTSSPRALLPAGFATIGEAIAWVAFAQAVPVQRWDLELSLGLSLWPWYPASAARQLLHLQAINATRTTLPFSKGITRGHRIWLQSALRELGSHRQRGCSPPTSHPGQPDEVVRAEAAERHAAWNEAAEAEVSAAFLALTLASNALRISIAERTIAASGVPTAGEGVDGSLQVVLPEICAAPVILTPDGLFPFIPNDLERCIKVGPSFVDIVLPARDLARAFPRTPGKVPDLLAAALGREPDHGEAGALAAQQNNTELVSRTGSPGRPTKSKTLYTREHRRRLASGEAFTNVTGEARYLLNEWLPTAWPGAELPTLKTLKNEITPEHRAHFGQPRLKAVQRSPPPPRPQAPPADAAGAALTPPVGAVGGPTHVPTRRTSRAATRSSSSAVAAVRA